MTGTAGKKPSAAQARKLLEEVDRLVLVQTNVFIRELLRTLDVKPPGATKEEFRAKLNDAIRGGILTKQKLDEWLRSIEGWGNQHIYAFSVPGALARLAAWADEDRVAKMAKAAFNGTWRAATSDKFPAKAKLIRIDYELERGLFVAEWHERNDSWARETDYDKRDVEIDGDTFWLQAYRLQPSRSVMRFALMLRPRVARRPVSALMLRVPIRAKEHREAIDLAWSDLDRLDFGGHTLAVMRTSPWSISNVIKRLDQEIVSRKRPEFKAKATRFSEGLASVEFVAAPDLTLPTHIYDVRVAIPASLMDDPSFVGSSGDFRMQRDDTRPISREAHVQLYQQDNRIRILTELDETDVWALLETFDAFH